jgi:hypothetical protein
MQLSEFFGIGLLQVFGKKIKFAENLQLKRLGQMRQFTRAPVIENNLKHDLIFPQVPLS